MGVKKQKKKIKIKITSAHSCKTSTWHRTNAQQGLVSMFLTLLTNIQIISLWRNKGRSSEDLETGTLLPSNQNSYRRDEEMPRYWYNPIHPALDPTRECRAKARRSWRGLLPGAHRLDWAVGWGEIRKGTEDTRRRRGHSMGIFPG